MAKEYKAQLRNGFYEILNESGEVSTIYSTKPILPDDLANKLYCNEDFQRKASLNSNEIDPKERQYLRVDGHEKVLSRLCSERSEDLVTFTTFESLQLFFKDFNLQKHLDVKTLLGGMGTKHKEKIRLYYDKTSDTWFWVPTEKDGNGNNRYRKALWNTIKSEYPRIISGSQQRTEIDAIHISTEKKFLVFLDAKLTAISGKCESSKYEKWATSNKNLSRYFKNLKQLDCTRYYQIIRNWYWGNILVDTVDEFKGWDFYLVHVGDVNHLQDMTFYMIFKEHLIETANREFTLTTWQNTASAIWKTLGEQARPLLDWLSNHPVTGAVYGQRVPLFPRK